MVSWVVMEKLFLKTPNVELNAWGGSIFMQSDENAWRGGWCNYVVDEGKCNYVGNGKNKIK